MNGLVRRRDSQFFIKCALYLNYLFIGALIFSYLACYINPNSFWGFSFFGLTYPVILIVNLLFILLWVYLKKIYLIFSLFTVLLGFSHIGKYIQINSSRTSSSKTDKINVLSFNVQNFSKEHSGIYDKEIQAKVFDFLQDQNADIVCIQEYSYAGEHIYASHVQLKKRLKANNYLYESYFKPKDSRVAGMVSFSRYPIVGKGIFDLPDTRKFGIYTDLKIKDDTIRLYNIHLESIRLNSNDYKYLTMNETTDNEYTADTRQIVKKLSNAFQKRAKQVDVLKEHIGKSPFPLLICGDFNDIPISYTYHQLSRNLQDAFVTNGNGLGKTLIGKIPAFRIDYILMDEDFTILNYDELKLNLSDHYPVRSAFLLK